jgi:hypothetical protein
MGRNGDGETFLTTEGGKHIVHGKRQREEFVLNSKGFLSNHK